MQRARSELLYTGSDAPSAVVIVQPVPPDSPESRRRRKLGGKLAWAGVALYLLSMILPVTEWGFGGSFWWSSYVLPILLMSEYYSDGMRIDQNIVPILVGALMGAMINTGMILGLLLALHRNQRLRWICAACLMLAFLMALAIPHLMILPGTEEGAPYVSLLIGYYVWVLSLCLAATGTLLRTRWPQRVY